MDHHGSVVPIIKQTVADDDDHEPGRMVINYWDDDVILILVTGSVFVFDVLAA